MRGIFFLLLAGCSGFDANLNVDWAGTASGTFKSKMVHATGNVAIDETGADGDLSVTPPPPDKTQN
jgi:hypothetical protein